MRASAPDPDLISTPNGYCEAFLRHRFAVIPGGDCGWVSLCTLHHHSDALVPKLLAYATVTSPPSVHISSTLTVQ
jgi:hypothetical protein